MGRKKTEEPDEEPVDDIYYGIHFRPAEEREKDAADEFAMLFDPTTGPDEEVEQRLFRCSSSAGSGCAPRWRKPVFRWKKSMLRTVMDLQNPPFRPKHPIR